MAQKREYKQAVALISAPWAIFSRPSIQLGSLKSYTEQHADVQISCLHPFLNIAKAIGINSYNRIAASGWAGEAVFTALLFPAMKQQAETLFTDSLADGDSGAPSFTSVVDNVREACRSWLDSTDWSRFEAAGFSVCFYQLLASLYLAQELKKSDVALPVIFGGSSCGGELGRSLLDHFKQIDFVVDGEGENAFTSLCTYLLGKSRQFPQRVFSREQSHTSIPTLKPALMELGDLPAPDYSDYFNQIGRLFPDMPFIPTLPLEFSRGCWWNKCTFCNLNLQWQGYRWKKSDKMMNDLAHLSSTHQCLDFTFTDNALPPREASEFFSRLQNQSADFRFFAEIRAVTDLQTLRNYSQAGLRTIQVGIEAFSSTLLEKMKKGVSVIENIAIMKYAAACGITLEGNLIIEFPGSTKKEVEETLTVLDYLLPFTPLSSAAFFLGFHSPVYDSPGKYGITGICHHEKNRALFPDSALAKLTLISMAWQKDRSPQKKLWEPVEKKVRQWQNFHNQRKTTMSPLSYREGGSFIIIRQEQPAGAPLLHRLKGASRQIYLFCNEIRTMKEIFACFPKLKESAILSFIDQLCEKRLMFRAGDAVISLAIQQA